MTQQNFNEAIQIRKDIDSLEKEIASIKIEIVVTSSSDVINQAVKSQKFKDGLSNVKKAVIKDNLSDALTKLIKQKERLEEKFSKL